MRVGSQKVDDATINLGAFKRANQDLADKETIQRAISTRDYEYLQQVSDFFYDISGVYGRLVRYLAYLYRYDWMVIPYVEDESREDNLDEIAAKFAQVLRHIEESDIKRVFGDIALKVVKNGVYYGYRLDTSKNSIIQELPPEYCRSRFFVQGKPLVEFNVKFFDDMFRDANQRANILRSFPKEFSKGYIAYKEGRLEAEAGEMPGWITLDSTKAIQFTVHGSLMPPLTSVIPAIIDLDEAQDLDKKKTMQELLKIVIQKMPFDKNGEMIFDIDEAQELHNNAVSMLGRAIGVDVLTTFADISVENMADKSSATGKDDLQRVERGVYNEAGISQMLFATDGNLALEKSVANDEASMFNLLLQFKTFLNDMVAELFDTPGVVDFRVDMLTTTIYNYKEMSNMYKDQAVHGYSKFLSQIALGQSQSSILASAHFENDVLEMSRIMVPLQSSHTMNTAEIMSGGDKEGEPANSEDAKGGRPEKSDDEKSDKTLANQASM